jgi:hypothetical protein
MNGKSVLLVALVLVNLLAFTGLVLRVTEQPAQAQVIGGGNNFAVITARLVGGNEDALWVLDLKTRKVAALRLPQGANRTMTVIGTRDIGGDLRVVAPGPGGPGGN